jgi:hypothetical protein
MRPYNTAREKVSHLPSNRMVGYRNNYHLPQSAEIDLHSLPTKMPQSPSNTNHSQMLNTVINQNIYNVKIPPDQ